MFFGTGSVACHSRLPRLSEQGRHAEVVERAGQARILPRGKSARAWARSLVALGRPEEARAVLLRDFRKHAELPSLVALADLEAAEGLAGLAAAHYARAASLETDPLAGRSDVCGLFRRRAARFLAEGEALAADLDLRRVAMICPKGKTSADEVQWRADRALHEEVAAAAKSQARAQRTLVGCEGERCRPPSLDSRTQALAQALAQARTAGPAALREAAVRLAVQLDPGDVAELLAAELRGELGLDLVDLDELRGWIGESAAADVVAAADARVSPLGRDYVRLRLAQLGPGYELPGDDAARSTASTVIRLLDAADDDPGAAAMSWRVFVLLGDLPSAEMALTGSLGARAGAGRAAAVADDLARETAGEPRAKPVDDASLSKGTGRRAKGKGAAATGAGGAILSGGTGGTSGNNAGVAGASVSKGTGPGPAGAGDAGLSGGTGRGANDKGVATNSGLSGGTGDARGQAGSDRSVGAASPASAAKAPGLAPRSGEPERTSSGASDMSSGPGTSGPAQRLVPPPALWSARAAVDASTLPRLLQLARLRGAAGRRDQAVAIAAWGLAEGQARGIPAIAELAAAEARHELAAGRPWAALALAAVVRGGPTDDVVRAAGSALVLEQAACGDRCDQADDRAAVLQLFGETWLLEQERRATESAHARAPAGPRGAACPLLAESLAPGASGPLADALRRARTTGLGAPELGERLRGAIEADLTLDCVGRIAVPLMYAADTRVAAEALADNLAHVPQEIAAGQLALQSELALMLGRRDHADQLAQAAAAASADPRAVWRRAAWMAEWIDARHYELLALRQLLLHGVDGSEADEVRLRLTVRAVRDANDAWAPRSAEAGREALIRGVESYLAEVPPARRWHAREALALALAEYAWTDEQAAALVRAAVWPDLSTVLTHPAGFRRLERAFGGDVPGVTAPELAPAQLAAGLAPVTPLGDPRVVGRQAAAKGAGSARAGGKDMASGAGSAATADGTASGAGVAPTGGEDTAPGTDAQKPGAKDMSPGAGSQRPGAQDMAKRAGREGHGGEDMASRSGSEGPGGSALPVEAEAFCAVDALQPARLAALRGLSGAARVRAAAALATTGDAAARRQALQQLVAGLDPARRAAVLDAVIVGLAAVPGREAAPMVTGDDALLAIVFGLVRDPARQPRELKGQDG
ncbi:hypothetical protein [Nannocystis bainbridge]|uniref:Uncharacterized protein n=1 Tax=Nannocystis bainbridge TaxID=2995303 RepID=A0ABT5E272_9BACT|nr:hypothetical protein [Nannocystis bainbridge]MDC0719510.1 hypothetical protein [Nannocystis bainbridge]